MTTRVEQDGNWVRVGSLEGKAEMWYDLSGDLMIIQVDDGSNVLRDVVTLDGASGIAIKVGGLSIDAGNLTITDDLLLGIGTGNAARLSWDTTDANANELLLQMPAGGAVDVPVLVIGQSIESVDLGLYNGVVDPRIALFGVGAVTTAPVIEFRKARGTVASPTVVTTGDDLGTLDFYGCVAAGEYVLAASIRADMAGTIATTRGPGTLTFLTATDAAPSVLTEALYLTAAQVLILGKGEGGTTAPTGNTLRAPNVATGGAGNVAGADLTIAAGLGTGTGDEGTLIFALPVQAAAGDNIQTLATRLTLDMAGSSTVLTILAAQALDIRVPATTDDAFRLWNGSQVYLDIDTRTTTSAINAVAFDTQNFILASGATAQTYVWRFNSTTLTYTGTTQVTSAVNTMGIDDRILEGDTATLTIDQANTLVLMAPREGTNVALTATSALRILNELTGTPVNQYGIYIEDLTSGATADYGIYIAGADTAAIYVASADPIHLGVAGASTGKMEIAGATSGTMTLTAAAATTDYTLTLPAAANTNAGYQLTCAGADTITSWAAAGSLRELKEMGRMLDQPGDAMDALDKILGVKPYLFHFKPGKGTLDSETEYAGLVADEAPWAMHYQGGVFNPISTFGYTVLAVQAMARRVEELEARLASLSR